MAVAIGILQRLWTLVAVGSWTMFQADRGRAGMRASEDLGDHSHENMIVLTVAQFAPAWTVWRVDNALAWPTLRATLL